MLLTKVLKDKMDFTILEEGVLGYCEIDSEGNPTSDSMPLKPSLALDE